MIVGEQKPLAEVKDMLAGHEKILTVGCGTCVTVCFAGGAKEVGVMSSALRMASKLDGNAKKIDEVTVQRQCEQEYINLLEKKLENYDVILSMGCGIGVQTLAERFPNKQVFPGLNTTFLGQPTEQGVWEERCQACGNCVLASTGGLCPISRCCKQLLNGPCGGSQNGKCEIDDELDCIWQLIWEQMNRLGQQDKFMEIEPPKNWSTSRSGGPRRIIRDDLRLPKKYQD